MTAPIENFSWKNNISQLYGVNKKLYLPNFGILGHNGLDIVVRGDKNGYGTKVVAAHRGTIRRLESDFPTKTKGNGIYLRSSLIDDYYIETVYWHLSDFVAKVGQTVEEGETIGLMGNTGFVFPRPTEQRPWDGTHLHFAYRKINMDGTIRDYNNGYRGYKDPTPLIYKDGDKLPMYWFRNLYVGKQGDDVAWLQTCLNIEGFAKDYDPTGNFRSKTLRDVIKLQNKYSITPPHGFFGVKTKGAVKKYSAFHKSIV